MELALISRSKYYPGALLIEVFLLRVYDAARLRCYLPEDLASRLLVGAIALLGSAVLVGSFLAPVLFPESFSSLQMTATDLVPFLLPW